MAQTFFKAGEDGFLVTRLDVDDAVGRQTIAARTRGKVLWCVTRQDLSFAKGWRSWSRKTDCK